MSTQFSLANLPEKNASDVVQNSMLAGVREQLKKRLMQSLEKDVDTAVEQALSQLKGRVSSEYSHVNREIVFHVVIDGVKRDV